MNTPLIPIPEPCIQPLSRKRRVFLVLLPVAQRSRGHFLQQQSELFTELLQGFEPVVAAVLVSISDEEAREELVDFEEGFLILGGGVEEGGRGDL